MMPTIPPSGVPSDQANTGDQQVPPGYMLVPMITPQMLQQMVTKNGESQWKKPKS